MARITMRRIREGEVPFDGGTALQEDPERPVFSGNGPNDYVCVQCGFCTPGMLLTARALLDENPDPTNEEIRVAISGQICRCTGYKNIIASIRWAAEHSEEVTA